jgi:hypothetical protein
MKRIIKFASLAALALGLMFVNAASSEAAEFWKPVAGKRVEVVRIEHHGHHHHRGCAPVIVVPVRPICR